MIVSSLARRRFQETRISPLPRKYNPVSVNCDDRENVSCIKSPDEYTVVVETSRGPKDFQYDQVFTPEHGQEKVFEDTNVSGAVDSTVLQSHLSGLSCLILAAYSL